ncbi:unnamed protein product [Moneuplotes crassus]|uniref:GOLD domain-containing protein n=1 Tax=Euplotes crassus TaxID=5936 RepID=A0AAD1XFK6_EUPCR|nr:unnamed protein product [Moneuplotes crassus]
MAGKDFNTSNQFNYGLFLSTSFFSLGDFFLIFLGFQMQLLFALLLVGFAVCDHTSFRYDLRPHDDICFTENLPENVSIIVEISSNSQALTLKVYNPKNQEIFNRGQAQVIRFPFTSFDAGTYKVCVVNTQNSMVEFSLDLKTGIDAKDYSDLVTKKHLEPAELEAQKIVDTVIELRKSMKRTNLLKENIQDGQNKLKTTLVSCGILSIGFILTSSVFSYCYLKSYFMRKKKD